MAWNNLGSIDWLAGRYPQAIEAFGKTLAIDPGDLNAHYNLMRVYRALGDRREGRLPRSGLPQVQGRRDRRARWLRTCAWQTRGTTGSRCPIHVHAEARRPRPRAAVLGRRDGPKGYQTDMGISTRTHPPILREA